MDDDRGWLRTHWRIAVALALIFGIALFLRFYFVYDLAFPDGLVSGGSDSYYWRRAIEYSFDTGKDLGWDPLLNYPVGLPNPRPPLFAWFALLGGKILAPLFGDAWAAVTFVFLASTGLFGALTVFPTYLLGKEAFGRRAGLIAAFFLAVSAAHLGRSQATDADHDAFTLFFVVTTFYFYLKALRALRARRWVETWFSRTSIALGLRGFAKENRTAVLYALLAGLSITAIALSWQGWAYVPVLLLVYFAVQLFLHRVRNEDTMGVTALFGIVLATPLLLALPWYAVRGQVRVWFDVPGYLFLVAMVLGAVFTVTRDYPWTLVIPSTFIAGGLGLAVGVLVNPALASAFVSGAGYFVQTKVYETIAEAQAPGLSQLILSFGWFTFYFSLAGGLFMIWQIPRRHEPAYTLIVVWAFGAIFMAMAAARFIFNASPAFAVAAAFAVDQVLRRVDFAGMRRTYRSLSEGSWRNALRKSVRLRHVGAALLLGGLVIAPNVWTGIDAAIPFELKATYDAQVHEALPSFLRAPGYRPSSGTFYFGAFGYSLPEEGEYFPAAWSWFRNQDADRPPAQRPAFLSWWDYGFEAVDAGEHPAVADNFQDGFAFAGQFITAQSEDEAVALLALRVLEGDVRNHRGTFSEPARAVLEEFGLPVEVFQRAYVRPGDLVSVIRDAPQVYGSWDAEIQPLNAMFIFLEEQLTSRLDPDRLADFYRAVRSATGYDIGYFAVDSRLFPVTVSNTGIFYAPVKLSDHRVIELPDGRTLPYEFFQIYAQTDRGRVALQDLGPSDQVQSESIEYQPMFYNSMFYRAYVGYSPSDLGAGTDEKGIPGIDENLRDSPPVPAWNLSHFRVVYRTTYYNPFADASNHTDAWRAINYDEVARIQGEIEAGNLTGVVDPSTLASLTNGVVFLRYYDGARLSGRVLAGGVTPVPGVRITVADELGTPHDVTTTDSEGRYTVLLPFGQITLTASLGAQNRKTLVGTTVLGTQTLDVSLAQALREDDDLDGDGIPDWILSRDFDVPGHEATGRAYFDLDADGVLDPEEPVLAGASVTFTHVASSFARTVATDGSGRYRLEAVPDGPYRVTYAAEGRTFEGFSATVDASAPAGLDLPLPHGRVRGTVFRPDGTSVPGAVVRLADAGNGSEWETRTDASGAFAFPGVLAGDATIEAVSGDLASLPALVPVSRGDAWQNLTVQASGRVAGVTRLFGTDQPHATIEFQSTSGTQLVRTVTSDGSGAFSAVLPAGEWNMNGRLYVGTRLYAALGRATVLTGETTSYSPSFRDGARVNGSVTSYGPEDVGAQIQVAFLSDAGDWWVRTGRLGSYVVYVPLGTYAVQALGPSSVFRADLSVAGSRTLDLALAEARLVAGSVYRDVNGNGAMDAGEGLAGARVDLRDDEGRRGLGVTNDTGAFLFPAVAARTYSGSVTARGFAAVPIPATTDDLLPSLSPIALEAERVLLTGSLLVDGVPLLKGGIAVRALPLGSGARDASGVTDSNGGFSLSLVPGAYELVVDVNVTSNRDRRHQNLEADRITLSVGSDPVEYDLDLVVRLLVSGTTAVNGAPQAATVSFEGPDVREFGASSMGFETYLQPGDYAVHASLSTGLEDYVHLGTVSVTAPRVLDLTLVRATLVTGTALHDGAALTEAIPVSFARAEGGSIREETAETGSYAARLAEGTYVVTVDFPTSETEGGEPRFVRYTFLGILPILSGETSVSFDLDLTRTLDNTTVSGTVRLDGTGVDASLAFLPAGNGALEARTVSGTSGTYSLGLAPGTYDVHATRTLGSAAFLGRVIVPHAAASAFDLTLGTAHTLTGVVMDPQGLRVSAEIAFAASVTLDVPTDGTGAYEVLLPEGSYALTASRTATERGLAIRYRATTTVDLRTDLVVNLVLQKIIDRSATLEWDSSQKQTIAGGQSVTYTFQVRNTGNVEDTFFLEGQHAGWTFDFSPSSVTLEYGSGIPAATVRVTIGSPKDAPVNHGPVSVVARSVTSGTDEGSVRMEVGILRYRGIAIQVNGTTGAFDGRFLNYTVELRNAGNAVERGFVQVANPGDLAALGWTARLASQGQAANGTRLTGVVLPVNGTARVRLELGSATGATGAPVILELLTEETPTLSASTAYGIRLPEVRLPAGIEVRGPNIVRTPSLNMTLVAAGIAIVSAASLALILTRRRR